MARRSVDVTSVIDGAHVVVCCGSGGVGKTTTSAAIALSAAERGRRAVVVTIDPARRLADAFGLVDGLTNQPSRIALPERPGNDTAGHETAGNRGELWAMMLDTASTFDDLVRRHAADDAQADRILSNSFYRNIAGALSGTQEYMAAEKLYELQADERFDLVVVDTPPTRNALDFLDAPARLTRFLDHRLYRLLMAPARGGMKVLNLAAQPVLRTIGRVVGAEVLADAIAFFQAFDGMESGFRDRASHVLGLLRSTETRYVVIASPRHDTIDEATFFVGKLAANGLEVAGVVVNRLQPVFGSATADEATSAAATAQDAGEHDLAALWANLAVLHRQAEAESTTIAPLLAAVGGAPVARVPLQASDVHDLDAIREIARSLGS
jgi:anion-transporting  ArsA/GET3 family ATPase